jgi:DNA replication protein DnaC
VAEEAARRKQTRLQRCTRSAHFPFFKTIEEFDFTLQSTLRESVMILAGTFPPQFQTRLRTFPQLLQFSKDAPVAQLDRASAF